MVSVIIPSYNRADIINETIDSVLAQTYANVEVIVIDDGSTDNTRGVVAAYRDPRLHYSYKTNGGLSAARNAGLDSARGEFIAFLDSDDVWQSWKLAAQMQIFERHPEVGLIWSDMSTFRKSGEILKERHLRDYYSAYAVSDFEHAESRRGVLSDLTKEAPARFADCPYYVTDVFHHMFSGNLVHPPTAIVRRSRLQKSGAFEPEVTGSGAEDYHFYFRVCSHGPVAFLDVPTILYRLHSSQISSYNVLNEARGNLKVITHWLGRRPPTLAEPKVRESLASSHAWLGSEELNAGNSRVAAYHLWQSLRLRLAQPSTFALLVVSLLPRRATDVLRLLKRALRKAPVRPLAAVLVFLCDDGSWLFDFADVLQSALA